MMLHLSLLLSLGYCIHASSNVCKYHVDIVQGIENARHCFIAVYQKKTRQDAESHCKELGGSLTSLGDENVKLVAANLGAERKPTTYHTASGPTSAVRINKVDVLEVAVESTRTLPFVCTVKKRLVSRTKTGNKVGLGSEVKEEDEQSNDEESQSGFDATILVAISLIGFMILAATLMLVVALYKREKSGTPVVELKTQINNSETPKETPPMKITI